VSSEDCVILYSGGTDSTCVAALLTERSRRLHLLTFYEAATRDSPLPAANVGRLRDRFGEDRFPHSVLSVDALLRRLNCDRYACYLRRHGFFMLSNCGLSSLAWHVRAIVYCLDNGIRRAADGVTRELGHFPGHMDPVLRELKGLYARFGIEYENPVRDWDVPADQRLIDRLIVDRHASEFEPAPEPRSPSRTTGRYLYELGLLPHPNVKGTDLDRSMQHACYPFVLFHIFAFWLYLPFHEYAEYEARMAGLFKEKIQDAARWLDGYKATGRASELAELL